MTLTSHQNISNFSHLVWPNGHLCNITTNPDTDRLCALLPGAKQVAQQIQSVTKPPLIRCVSRVYLLETSFERSS